MDVGLRLTSLPGFGITLAITGCGWSGIRGGGPTISSLLSLLRVG